MFAIAVFVAVNVVLLGVLILYREPKLIIPAVVLLLPVEVFETQAVNQLGATGGGGIFRSVLNPGQTLMMVAVAYALVHWRHDPRRFVPDSALVLPLTAMVALNFLGIAWSDSYIPPNGVLVLTLYFAFVCVMPSFIEDRRDVERILGAFLLAACLLGVLAVLQRVTGVFNWRGILIQSDDYSYRSNATFADPNNLARFLALAMSLAIGLILATGPRRMTLYLAIPALVFALPGTIATASRSGWVVFLFCAAVVVWLAPVARWTKVRISTIAVLCVAGLIGMLVWHGGTDAERVESLASGVTVIGQREFLIRAGWAMFRDNPLVGVGTGNFQHALIVSYIDTLPSWARTTLSHTSFISILAELGVAGAATLVLVVSRVAVTAVRTYRGARRDGDRVVVGWLIAALAGVFLQSQSEGRLLDEPYLWVLLALLIAFEVRRWPEADEAAGEPARPGAQALAGGTVDHPALAPAPEPAALRATAGVAPPPPQG